ncbi:hypothetical protein C9F00_24395, partial [Salmonella enterica subsp. enterica serovar Wilhelmsburg]
RPPTAPPAHSPAASELYKRQLAASGHLVERPRYKKGFGTRTFTLPQPLLDELGQQAQREWEALGYVVGQMMDPIPEPAPCKPSN